MMDFLNAVKEMREGKKVRLPFWNKDDYIIIKDESIEHNKFGDVMHTIALSTLERDDWEIYEKELERIPVPDNIKFNYFSGVMCLEFNGSQHLGYSNGVWFVGIDPDLKTLTKFDLIACNKEDIKPGDWFTTSKDYLTLSSFGLKTGSSSYVSLGTGGSIYVVPHSEAGQYYKVVPRKE